ncbi:hypothetical protein B0H12DRAFT_1158367 [Mycena haematopus]|nr:hypothetical protein B0H12DRAFT_1158367 [Mycena haematopus]
MVKSRWKSPNCALSRVMLPSNFVSDPDTLEEKFELLRREGLDFRLFPQKDMTALHASWLYYPMYGGNC